MSFETHFKQHFLESTNDPVAVGHVAAGETVARIVYVNRAFTELFGVDSASLNKPIADIVPDPDSWQNFADLGNAAQKSAPSAFCTESNVTRLDGSQFWTSVSFSTLKIEDSEGHYICATYRDISSLKNSEVAANQAYDRIIGALNAYPDPFVVYDRDLKLVCWNNGYLKSVTHDDDVLVPGMHLREILKLALRNGRYPIAVGREEEWIEKTSSSQNLENVWEDVELDGDVHHRILRSRSSNGDYVTIRLNTTELVRQKRESEESRARLVAALNAYPAPFAIYDSQDCLVVWNDAYCQSMSDDPDALQIGMHRSEAARIAVQAGKFLPAIGNEKKWMSKEHQEATVLLPVEDLELAGDIHHRLLRTRVENGDLVLLRIDTTELVRQRRAVESYAKKLEVANHEITHKALHDELTGLGNRRYLTEKFDSVIEYRRQNGGDIACLHIDLDRFKQINDTLGHAAGDHVLIESSKRILRQTRKDDVVARIGGDEYVVLLNVPTGSKRQEELANTLLTEMALPAYFEGKECRFGASIGLAHTPLSEVDELLVNSDVALYKAKRNGRGQLGIFDRLDLNELHRSKALADDILRGIEQNEFVPFYQPQADAHTGEIVGLEALARWNHPERGVLSPQEFLTVATDLNVVADIDKIVFETAIEECTRTFTGSLNPPSLSFNVSARRVNENDFGEIQRRVFMYPGQVCFELLETIFLEEEDDGFLMQLDRLREMDISIEVDDFGSGRASVVALQRIGPERLKIDRRLVMQVTAGANGLHLLRSIVEIGHSLEMGVTAEGVETQEQAEILAELGCDRLQGYLIAKPMSFDDLCVFLELGNNQLRRTV